MNKCTRLLLQDAAVPGNMSSVSNLLFHAVHSDFSDQWPFGLVTLWTSDPSPCKCVNWLWTSLKWPFTGAVLQSTSPSNPPARLPVMGSTEYPPRVCGQLVSRSVWYQISHAIQVCRFIHLGDAHSKQWAAICSIQVTIYGYSVTAGEDWLQPRD